MCDQIREQTESMVAVLACVNGEKANIAVCVGKQALEAGLSAGKIVREVAKLAGGSGGGRPEFAMAGVKTLQNYRMRWRRPRDYCRHWQNKFLVRGTALRYNKKELSRLIVLLPEQRSTAEAGAPGWYLEPKGGKGLDCIFCKIASGISPAARHMRTSWCWRSMIWSPRRRSIF